jgi:hypothetical protein
MSFLLLDLSLRLKKSCCEVATLRNKDISKRLLPPRLLHVRDLLDLIMRNN